MQSPTLAEPSPRAPAVEVPLQVPEPARRLVSLDVFRGATVAAMLLVNNPGSWAHVYPPLRHAEWHGWTPTDLIFPFFLFVVGVAMSLSFARQRAAGAGRGELLARAARRAAVLFLLGLALHAFPWWGVDLAHLRIPGVLQRIGLAFLGASAVVLAVGRRGWAGAAAALLLGYWALMAWVPVPGVGAGVWEPGKDLGAYLDRLVFGTDHLWAQSRTWDPEGLLGTLPAVATVLLGALAGEWLRSARAPIVKIRGMLLAGAGAVALGQLWHLAFPINKPLWTSSYVVFTAGMALLGLSLCYWLVDVRGYRRWSLPFLVFGVNAIAAFFLSGLMARLLGMLPATLADGTRTTLKGWIHQTLFASWLPPLQASLAFALAFVLFWTGVMWVMHRRGIWIKV